MNGTLSVPIQLDDAAIRDELANLRLQASALVASVNWAGNLLADLKATMGSLTTALAALTGDVLATHAQLAQIQTELDILRDLIPPRKPTFVLSLSVKNKETV